MAEPKDERVRRTDEYARLQKIPELFSTLATELYRGA